MWIIGLLLGERWSLSEEYPIRIRKGMSRFMCHVTSLMYLNDFVRMNNNVYALALVSRLTTGN